MQSSNAGLPQGPWPHSATFLSFSRSFCHVKCFVTSFCVAWSACGNWRGLSHNYSILLNRWSLIILFILIVPTLRQIFPEHLWTHLSITAQQLLQCKQCGSSHLQPHCSHILMPCIHEVSKWSMKMMKEDKLRSRESPSKKGHGRTVSDLNKHVRLHTSCFLTATSTIDAPSPPYHWWQSTSIASTMPQRYKHWRREFCRENKHEGAWKCQVPLVPFIEYILQTPNHYHTRKPTPLLVKERKTLCTFSTALHILFAAAVI